jgi:ParB family chromosome partitioning protein
VKTVKLTEIIIGDRHRKNLGDIDALAASIAELGLLHPIVVTPALHLIAGRRRLEAVRRLGWSEVDVRVVERLDDALLVLRAERDENSCRKSFTPSEAIAIGKALEDLERTNAKARQGRPGQERSGNLPEHARGDTRDKVAEAVDMSGRTYEKAKEVVAAGEQQPEEFAEVVKEMDSTGRVDPAFKKVRAKKATNKQAKRASRKQGKKKAGAAPANPLALPCPPVTQEQEAKIKEFLGELSFEELSYTAQEVINRPTCLGLSTTGLDIILVHLRTTHPGLAPLVRGVAESLSGPDAGRALPLWRALVRLNRTSMSELLAELPRADARKSGEPITEGGLASTAASQPSAPA